MVNIASQSAEKNHLDFRPVTADDNAFLCHLYGTTRADEMTMVPWTDEQKQEFVEMQFNAQHSYYQEQFQQAEFNIVMYQGQDIGRLYTDQREHEIRIIDITLLPEFRGQGYGFQLLSDILDQAKLLKLSVTIHVEKNNPAMSLYHRLGFVRIEDQGVYDLMRWKI